jgi:hypothetical protein
MGLCILQPRDTLEVYAGEEGDEREVELTFEALDHAGLLPRSACMRVLFFVFFFIFNSQKSTFHSVSVYGKYARALTLKKKISIRC